VGSIYGDYVSPILKERGNPYDPQQAKALMEEAGYGDGFDVNFNVSEGGANQLMAPQMAQIIQANLAEIGINVKIQVRELSTWYDYFYAGDFEMSTGHIAPAGPDLWNPLFRVTYAQCVEREKAGKSRLNVTCWQNEVYDGLLEQLIPEQDEVRKHEIAWRMQEIMADEVVQVWVLHGYHTAAFDAKLEGVEITADFWMPDFRNAKWLR